MPRLRLYQSNADRQAAYRLRCRVQRTLKAYKKARKALDAWKEMQHRVENARWQIANPDSGFSIHPLDALMIQKLDAGLWSPLKSSQRKKKRQPKAAQGN